ncbi:hypothetical protein LC040_00315 [Bacillus tianshenii]|nr:hypothetical protein LC040_00315 [Bacillus tianshenii]
MTRLTSALTMDFRMQWRYKFVHAAAFISIVWLVILTLLPTEYMNLAIPFVIFGDLGIVGFYLLAGMILFEKGESTLQAIVVSPLSFFEYLTAKVIAFTVMAVVISLVIVFSFAGFGVNYFYIITGTALTSVVSLLIAFIAVAPYKSISSFLMPSQLYMLVMNLPLLDYFGWLEAKWLYVIPLQASLLLLEGGFRELSSFEVLYGFLYQGLWIVLLYLLAKRSYEKYLVKE